MSIKIDITLCDNCKKCIKICKYKAILNTPNSKEIKIQDWCTECLECIKSCKNKAIYNSSNSKTIPDFSSHKDIYVFIEFNPISNEIRKVSLEILAKAKELASIINEKLIAILVGFKIKNYKKTLENLGIDSCLVIENKILKDYSSESYSEILNKIILNKKPKILLFGSTYLGRDLAPRVAKIAKVGLTADCTDLSINKKEGLLIQTRPAFSGNLLAEIVNRYSRPQIATIRAGVITSNKPSFKKTKFEFLSLKVNYPNTTILKKIIEEKRKTKLNNAKVIIAGGRGMKNTDGFKLIYKLASAINGEVAGTRVAVENGWINEKNQVGQTGLSVKPDLYIACGISGAIQHRAGITNSKFIIAINNDPYAPIFKVSDWGIIGNVFEILPKLIYNLEKNK